MISRRRSFYRHGTERSRGRSKPKLKSVTVELESGEIIELGDVSFCELTSERETPVSRTARSSWEKTDPPRVTADIRIESFDERVARQIELLYESDKS